MVKRTCDICDKPCWGYLITERRYYPELKKLEERNSLICHECYMNKPLSAIKKSKIVVKY